MSKYRDYYENEDDPDVYESSSEEWTDTETIKKGNGRRSSTRTKKPRVKVETSSSDSECEKPKRRSKKNGVKKLKVEPKTAISPTSKASPSKPVDSKDYHTGAFLILKRDAQVGDPNKHPCIWRVDGKALLQKYEAFDDDGKIRHRTTSVYTGWSALDRDQYAPITVEVHHQNGQNMVVNLDWEKVKQINMDSD